MRRIASLVLFVFALVLPPAPPAQANDSSDILGYRYGCTDYTATGGWDTFTSASLESMTGSAALPAAQYWTELTVKAPSAVTYVCIAAGASCGANTTNKLSAAASSVLTLSIRGQAAKSVALYAVIGTTAQVCGFFRASP